jgi:hypothetical protein
MTNPSVFISYSHEDQTVARVIAAGLTHRGCTVWIDEGELRAGDSVIERISAAVGQAEFLVALISRHSVESRWCRKEIALAMTGELDKSDVPVVLPLRLGQVEIPPTLADKLWISVGTDRPEHAIQQLYQDILAHAQARRPHLGTSATENLATVIDPQPTVPDPASSSLPVPASLGTLRAHLLESLSDSTSIRAVELLRQERRAFEDSAHEQLNAAETASPGPSIDFDRFRELEIELASSFDRRFATLLPIVQYGTPETIREELRWLGRLANANWGLSGASYAAWTTSPRWLVTVLCYSVGATACGTARWDVIRELWETPGPDAGSPLPIMQLLGADDLSRALEQARFGKRLALGPFWHTAAILASSDVCAEHYPEMAPVLERALRQLADFSWMVSAFAGRDGLEAIHWWCGVAHYAGDGAAARLAAELVHDPHMRKDVCSLFDLDSDESDVMQLRDWANNAPGPRPQ